MNGLGEGVDVAGACDQPVPVRIEDKQVAIRRRHELYGAVLRPGEDFLFDWSRREVVGVETCEDGILAHLLKRHVELVARRAHLGRDCGSIGEALSREHCVSVGVEHQDPSWSAAHYDEEPSAGLVNHCGRRAGDVQSGEQVERGAPGAAFAEVRV